MFNIQFFKFLRMWGRLYIYFSLWKCSGKVTFGCFSSSLSFKNRLKCFTKTDL